MGGNAVVSRAMLRAAGPYNTALGPRANRRLCSCEDEDMYLRLLDVGARGQYRPDLVVHHHVHQDRLAKRYFRSWCFWNGASKGVLSRRRSGRGHHVAGVPRYAYGEALRGLVRWAWTAVRGGPASARTAAELPSWHLAGRLYGRFLQRDDPRRDPGAGIESRVDRALRR